MPKLIGINIGFITNSSSMVHHFPKKLLEDPAVKAFLSAFECEDGFIGDDLWHRGQCGSFAVTREQKEKIQHELTNNEYGAHGPSIAVDDDEQIVVVYGDEHPDLAMQISRMLAETAVRMGLRKESWGGGQEYN